MKPTMEPFEPLLEKYRDSVIVLDREAVHNVVCLTFEECHFPSDPPVFQNTVLRQSVEELDQQEVARLLGTLPIPYDATVTAIWNGQRGVITNWGHLLDVFDDIWYPMRDDLLVIVEEGEWLVYVFHEEFLTVGRRS